MNIYQMKEGGRYLIGDSLGYDIVICRGQSVLADLGLVVNIRFEESGIEDFLYENPESPFLTYVEPR